MRVKLTSQIHDQGIQKQATMVMINEGISARYRIRSRSVHSCRELLPLSFRILRSISRFLVRIVIQIHGKRTVATRARMTMDQDNVEAG
ncbi:hypothetical protein [Faecalibaculum rodentium]|uniref:hypothetical protein n=1 Tax=Faecalibaculum rodentium TaxID=1702221 RepID=UPI002622EFA4|nr:hypothetical protein [Faecalibaculum rodentium]